MKYIQFAKLTDSMITVELGRRFKQYRIQYRMTQQEVAAKTGIGIATLRNFENGRLMNINLNNFLALMRVIDRIEEMQDVLPEIPLSAYEMEKLIKKKVKRVKHGRDDIKSNDGR